MDTITIPKFEDLLEKDDEALCAIIVWWFSHAGDYPEYRNVPRDTIVKFYATANFDYDQFRLRNLDTASLCAKYAAARSNPMRAKLAHVAVAHPRMFVKRAMKLGFIEQAMRCSQALDKMGWPK